MSRDVQGRFADIIAAIARCEQYRHRLDDPDPLDEAMAYDTILRNVAVVGEAVRALPDSIKAADARTPWASIAGLPNIVIHEYFCVDVDLIAEIVADELEPLAEAIGRLSPG